MARVPRWLVYGSLAVIGLVAWSATKPDERPVTRSTVRPPKKLRATQEIYAPEDYAARGRFAVGVALSRNAFRPVLARAGAGQGGIVGDSGVPATFATGDPNWVCTGIAEVDAVRMALLENKATGEGVFLRQGDRWKSAVVSKVLADGVVLAGPSGEVRTIRVSAEDSREESPELQPMQVPGLTGLIGGNGVTVTPQRRRQPERMEQSAIEMQAVPATPPGGDIDEEGT